MKLFLRNRLERYAQRLSELDFLLSREDIMKDMAQFLVLSREHAEVSQIAGRYQRYQQRESDLAAAREMQADAGNDAEEDPYRQVAFEHAHRRAGSDLGGDFALG